MMDLRSREKKIIAICAVVVLAAIVHIAAVSPSVKKRDQLERSIRKAQIQLQELRILEHEYDQILMETKKIRQHMGGRSRDFELLLFLSQTANKLDIENNLTRRNPSRRELDSNLAEELVELELKGISQENLTAYLHEIERKGRAVAITSIRVRPESRLGGGLNVSMLVTSISSS